MGILDCVLLALLGAYVLFAARRLRKPQCGGDCGACRGCNRAE